MGLNDLQSQGQLEWVSTSGYKPEYKYNNFGVDADLHDSSRRCTFSLFSNNLPPNYGQEGKWYKEKCEKTKGLDFICKLDEQYFVREQGSTIKKKFRIFRKFFFVGIADPWYENAQVDMT